MRSLIIIGLLAAGRGALPRFRRNRSAKSAVASAMCARNSANCRMPAATAAATMCATNAATCRTRRQELREDRRDLQQARNGR